MTDPIHISLGSLSPPIDERLREQGQKLDIETFLRGYLQRGADDVTCRRCRCILTEAVSDKARKRILQIIKKQAKPL